TTLFRSPALAGEAWLPRHVKRSAVLLEPVVARQVKQHGNDLAWGVSMGPQRIVGVVVYEQRLIAELGLLALEPRVDEGPELAEHSLRESPAQHPAGQGGPESTIRLGDCGQPLGRELEHEALRVAAHAARLLDWHQQVRRRQVALKLAVEIAWKHLPHVDVRVGKKLQRRGCDAVADRPLDGVLVLARFHPGALPGR